MDALFSAALGNLLSPLVLSFVLGLVAGLVKSDLDMPEVVGKAIAIYLMLAIGLKGGVEMAQAGIGLAILPALLAALLLSFGMPYIAYPLLRRLAGADRVNAAAVAAHYGSVSIVTFVAATQMLARDGIGYEGYLVAMLAVMETPAIIAGLLLAGRALALEGDSGAAAPDRGDRRITVRSASSLSLPRRRCWRVTGSAMRAIWSPCWRSWRHRRSSPDCCWPAARWRWKAIQGRRRRTGATGANCCVRCWPMARSCCWLADS
jgi:hypothetical protein